MMIETVSVVKNSKNFKFFVETLKIMGKKIKFTITAKMTTTKMFEYV